jgi:hypothetical protein
MKFVNTLDEFRQNLAVRFFADLWLDAIDFSKFSIVGGCVVNSLCYTAFLDTHAQDINIIYPTDCCIKFFTAVENTITRLQAIFWNKEIKVEKYYGSLRYDVYLPCKIKLNFLYISTQNSKNPISHILYNFDFDICQVAFLGKSLFLNNHNRTEF